MSNILVLPQIQIQKANAFSSSYSVGFPALTAWHGFVHALERQLQQSGFDVHLSRFGVVSYAVDVHRHFEPGDRLYSLKAQGQPLKADGSRPSANESATCDLTVTVVAEIQGDEFDCDDLIRTIQKLMHGRLRCAGGFITRFHKPWVKHMAGEGDWFWLRRTLMPGQALISRRDLLENSMEQTGDAIESLITLLSPRNVCGVNETTGEVTWTQERTQEGWIVPMGVGFCGISELKPSSQVLHSRDDVTPHRFVESAVSLCEFVLTYKLESLEEMLWSANYDAEQELYLIESNK